MAQKQQALRVLAVDDEELVLSMYQRILLSRHGAVASGSGRDAVAVGAPAQDTPNTSFEVIACRSGTEAIEAVRESIEASRPFALAFVDLRMPSGPDGIETAVQMRMLDAHINIIMVTGYSDVTPGEIARRVPPADKLLYLQKPLHMQEVLQLAASLGAKWRIEQLLEQAHEELQARVRERTSELAEVNLQLRKDIAERKRAEESLRSLSLALESAANTVVITDREGAITWVNAAFSRLTGFSAQEALGQTPHILKSGKHPAELHEDLWRTIVAGKVWQGEIINKHKDGVFYTAELTVTPVHDEHQAITHFIGIMQDISERKRAEAEVVLQQQRLIQADKMASLGVLVSGVAHEINNPNHFVMSNTSVLSRMWDNAKPILDEYYRAQGDFLIGGMNYSEIGEQIPEIFSEVLDGSKRIKKIVQELRDFASECASDFTEPVDINDVIRSATTLMTNMLKKSTKHFQVSLGTDLPLLNGVFQRIEQVVINLIQNACQALPGPDKGISVCTRYDGEQDAIVLRVSDEGAGIPLEALERITDPFFTTKRDSGGTGLGLSISSSIINEHGGALEFASVPGEGTTVTVTLPLKNRGVSREDGQQPVARVTLAD